MTPSTYLVDTDWIIHYLNGKQEVVDRLKALRKDGIAISIISLGELYEGIYYSTDPSGDEIALNDFLTGVSVFGIEEEDCRLFGKERGRLRSRGKKVNDFDLMIASCCLRWNLTLLTNNRKHFEQVDGLKLISSTP